MATDEKIRGYVDAGTPLLGAKFYSLPAKVLMTAIGLQESRFDHTDQLEANGANEVLGPALGYWQFESGGGVKGVMNHASTSSLAKDAADRLNVPWVRRDVWTALKFKVALASVFARLLLYSDPKPLPSLGEVEAAWQYYLRTWRPGKPHRKTWDALYARAMAIWSAE